MIKIDLITGFLGAGKTTFIEHYTRFLNGQGLRVGIIENDFGAVNVDMLLLQDLEGDLCEIEPIVGGNLASDWQRRFKAKLVSLAMQGMNRVLVEPSGIYEVDTFFEVLNEEPLSNWYEVGSVLTIVNAKLERTLTKQAESMLVAQAAVSGQVLLSDCDEVDEQEILSTRQYLENLWKKYNCEGKLADRFVAKAWENFTEKDFQHLMESGYEATTGRKLLFDRNQAFDSLFFMKAHWTKEEISLRVKALMETESYGSVIRLKGFFLQSDESWLEVNATRDRLSVCERKKGQEVVIVIGENLKEEALREFFYVNFESK